MNVLLICQGLVEIFGKSIKTADVFIAEMIILNSPNGTPYEVTVGDDGNVAVTPFIAPAPPIPSIPLDKEDVA